MINLFVTCLRFIYFWIKLFTKSQNKIVYLSRQSNEKSLDMKMLSQEISRMHPEYCQTFRLRVLQGTVLGGLKYLGGLMIDMYHIATAQVAICDTYSIAISCLKHKKNLTVIQIWHALGAIKKFGLQSLGKSGGRDLAISKAMHMHENYDYVLAPSLQTAEFYKEAFGVEDKQLVLFPLPHMDYVKDLKVWREKQQFGGRKLKTVVYLPTFRETEAEAVEAINRVFSKEIDIKLIISLHPLSKVKIEQQDWQKNRPSIYELMKNADCVVTDYSACAFEAALMGIPLYFYVPDYQQYEKDRGLNIELKTEMGKYVFMQAEDLLRSIKTDEYDYKLLQHFRDRYLIEQEDCTGEIAEFVCSNIKENKRS